MCPKYSPPVRAAPFPTQWLSPVRISHLSNGTMKLLRLPLSFLHLRFPLGLRTCSCHRVSSLQVDDDIDHPAQAFY